MWLRLISLRQDVKEFNVYVENWDNFRDHFLLVGLTTYEAHYVFVGFLGGNLLLPASLTLSRLDVRIGIHHDHYKSMQCLTLSRSR